ncbi:GAP family protein [Haladaptatus pallidirubidus]|uniref:Sap, sulfolipid-1-addressing protein n=1 Tax=Haladaptatus pallidirubidus TaxID=1008152 RepID=A0AAV3UFD0_9EURY|nr:GAP family protein [Haladaptatus pallidirubidus]
MTVLEILPLAFVMVAGPQILSTIFLATSENWRWNSAAYVFGASLSITFVVLATYLLGNGITAGRTSNDTVHLIVLLLLLVAMVHVYLNRKESEPPKWMGKLEKASPRFSFRLGFLLLGFFPTDILTSSTVGSYLAGTNRPLDDSIPFILLTLLFLASPSITLIVFGSRAETFLPKARDWMNANSWVVNEVVLLFFVGMNIRTLVG